MDSGNELGNSIRHLANFNDQMRRMRHFNSGVPNMRASLEGVLLNLDSFQQEAQPYLAADSAFSRQNVEAEASLEALKMTLDRSLPPRESPE
jgi:hypothetical protein